MSEKKQIKCNRCGEETMLFDELGILLKDNPINWNKHIYYKCGECGHSALYDQEIKNKIKQER
jgi:DNA-directed RNA polymerase subunit M/transcription elongation factor TFIIS